MRERTGHVGFCCVLNKNEYLSMCCSMEKPPIRLTLFTLNGAYIAVFTAHSCIQKNEPEIRIKSDAFDSFILLFEIRMAYVGLCVCLCNLLSFSTCRFALLCVIIFFPSFLGRFDLDRKGQQQNCSCYCWCCWLLVLLIVCNACYLYIHICLGCRKSS